MDSSKAYSAEIYGVNRYSLSLCAFEVNRKRRVCREWQTQSESEEKKPAIPHLPTLYSELRALF